MTRTLLPLVFASLLAVPTAASAQAEPLVLVIDSGPVRIDADAFREQLSATTGRDVVDLGDARARGATGTLTIARTARHAWVLRYVVGDREVWSTESIEGSAIRRALLEASVALLSQAPAPTAATPDRGPVVTPENTWVRAEPDLVDPFRETWSPLQVALDGELMRPFGDIVTSYRHASWHDLADPFADRVGEGVFDPWSRR